ncbi:hypothetical protein [Hymenobacter sp. DG01]|uniref:hypothetical protein n=1 Tax=Hymenobacter sp. DG01 TaxID=2584940 RepID=UPI001124AD4C|nr:hypothetical protein [Hymenobacter sp. DG01]
MKKMLLLSTLLTGLILSSCALLPETGQRIQHASSVTAVPFRPGEPEARLVPGALPPAGEVTLARPAPTPVAWYWPSFIRSRH